MESIDQSCLIARFNTVLFLWRTEGLLSPHYRGRARKCWKEGRGNESSGTLHLHKSQQHTQNSSSGKGRTHRHTHMHTYTKTDLQAYCTRAQMPRCTYIYTAYTGHSHTPTNTKAQVSINSIFGFPSLAAVNIIISQSAENSNSASHSFYIKTRAWHDTDQQLSNDSVLNHTSQTALFLSAYLLPKHCRSPFCWNLSYQVTLPQNYQGARYLSTCSCWQI